MEVLGEGDATEDGEELGVQGGRKKGMVKTLEGIIDEKRKQIEHNSYSKSGGGLTRFYDQEKIAFLESTCNMLQNIQDRLEVLEMKD